MSTTGETAAVLPDAPNIMGRVGPRRPFTFRHGLAGHSQLGLDALADLAATLPASQVEHHLADLPLVLPSGATRQLPEGAGPVIRAMESNGCWAVIWHVQRVGAYRELMDRCTHALPPAVPGEGPVTQWSANVFVASPGAVVPVHLDRKHNFLFQIHGTKTVTVGTFADPITGQLEIERNFPPERENAHSLPTEVTVFDLCPGDGLYIPPYIFHWVVNGPAASASFSCVFATAATARDELVHAFNKRVRRFGVGCRPPGASPAVDRAKAYAVRAQGFVAARAARAARAAHPVRATRRRGTKQEAS